EGADISRQSRSRQRVEDNAFHLTSEKIVRILLEAGGANQIQARECAAGQGPNREYAKTKCADRDRFCRSLEGSLMNKNPAPQSKSRDRASHSETATVVAAALWAALVISTLVCATSFAQTSDNVAEREVQRR